MALQLNCSNLGLAHGLHRDLAIWVGMVERS